jgi:glycosyltransferase involved in cell wall biosynthesis
MSLRDPHLTSGSGGGKKRAVILTSYRTGATRGKNLGVPGYSYDIVAQLFVPLLARWGEVIQVAPEAEVLEAAVQDARRRGLDPVHVSFLPFQDFCPARSAPNVIVPAWEFPDVPDHVFDGNPRNNWVATARSCDLVIVGGPFTVDTFRRAGITTPIRVVPVPTPDEYFRIPAWRPDQCVRIPCSAYVSPNPAVPAGDLWDAAEAMSTEAAPPARTLRGRLRDLAQIVYKEYLKSLVPPVVHGWLKTAARRLGWDGWQRYVAGCRQPQLELSGVVYTSIFNPGDGRKNWEDMLSAFLWGLRDRDDATLVLKLVTQKAEWIERILAYYRRLGLAHRCKVVFITDYLKDEHMLDLVRASTYYFSATRAEGNCLPVMNYLAAGRPCVTTCHTAISDYFSDAMGFRVQTHPEPCIWPHDNRLRFRTTWGRIVWPSLVEQLRQSYHIARHERVAYDARSACGQSKITEWASVDSIWPRLRAALDLIDTLRRQKPIAA